MLKLEEVGFEHTLRPVACWERNGWDLALVREYIPGAVEGRLLALTSLRDLLGRNLDDDRPKLDEVGGAGGDLSSEVRRLGETTGSLHLALAEAFGVRALPAGDAPRSAAIRVHGDYHLRRVFRTDAGWIVGGFGDDPLIGKLGDSTQSREPRFVSPLEDLADLSYSLRQVAAEAVAAQPAVTLCAGRETREGLGASQPGLLPQRLPRRRRHRQAHRVGPPGGGRGNQVPGHRACDGNLGSARSLGPPAGAPASGGCGHAPGGGVRLRASRARRAGPRQPSRARPR